MGTAIHMPPRHRVNPHVLIEDLETTRVSKRPSEADCSGLHTYKLDPVDWGLNHGTLLAQSKIAGEKRRENDVQKIPLRVYQSDTHIMVAAPMPGVEPGDVSVTIEGDKLIIKGHERGVGQNRRDVLLDECKIGPYYREACLPQAVDGSLTNATYGNGVLLDAQSTRRRRRYPHRDTTSRDQRDPGASA